MTREERAAQIWSLLTLCASMRRTMTYDELSKRIGVLRPGLGQLLEPIQSLCILRDWPPLTALVVSHLDGLPGPGFIAAPNVPSAQAKVFSFDWLGITTPDPEMFDQAVKRLPSNGKSLEDLQRSRHAQVSLRPTMAGEDDG